MKMARKTVIDKAVSRKPVKRDISLTPEGRINGMAAIKSLSVHLEKSIPVYNRIPSDKRDLFLSRNPILGEFIRLTEQVER